MTYEIKNMDCYNLFRNRPGYLNRRRHSQSVVWPARINGDNTNVEEYIRHLNCQRRLRNQQFRD